MDEIEKLFKNDPFMFQFLDTLAYRNDLITGIRLGYTTQQLREIFVDSYNSGDIPESTYTFKKQRISLIKP